MGTILHVENDPSFQEYVHAVLDALHTVETVSTLGDALLALQRTDVAWDGILLDLNLLDSDGALTLKRLAQASGLIPITVLTGYVEGADEGTLVRIVDKNAVMAPDALREEVARLLQLRESSGASGHT